MSEARTSPVLPQVLLLIAFLAVAAVGVFTVILPELTADEPEDDAPAGAAPAAADED